MQLSCHIFREKSLVITDENVEDIMPANNVLAFMIILTNFMTI